MASRPKYQKLQRTLKRLAQTELGEGAEGIDWVVSKIEAGATMGALAEQLATEMQESCSRSWLSWMVNSDPAHKVRIAAARKESSHLLLDAALDISDEPAGTSAEVQRNRLRADSRIRLAAMFNREAYGPTQQPQVAINLGALHIEAMRRRTLAAQVAPQQLGAGEELAQVIVQGEQE